MGIFGKLFRKKTKKKPIVSPEAAPTEENVWLALKTLAEIEEAVEKSLSEASDDYMESYRAETLKYEVQIAEARDVLKTFAISLQPTSLEEMQKYFYSFSGSPVFQHSTIAISAVRTHLSTSWDGIGPWQK